MHHSNGPTITLRDPIPGDYGWIIHKQGLLYAQEYGWDISFEALLAEIIGKFSKEFVPGREKCWVAVRGEEVVGSIFIVLAVLTGVTSILTWRYLPKSM